ncbi:MAG TPA: hypothetical protein VH300_11195 [Thermoleophilaceae bacterium]|nr:hypothetical protein [Thermoleophilaceae bacterium]
MTVVAAAAAAALAATAVVALPAIGDSGTTGTDQSPDVSGLPRCLAKEGLPGAPASSAELKPWLKDKEAQDPGAVHAALAACQSSAPDANAPGPDAATLIACVRSHGYDAPTSPVDFKRWLGQKHEVGDSAVDDTVAACNDAQEPQGSGDTKAK